MLIQTAASMVLARLLTPSEIGKFSIAMAILATAHMLREFGVGAYIVQAKSFSKQDMKAVFGITLLLAWSMAGIVYLSRHLIADFYHEPALVTIMAWMTLNFLIIPFNSIVFPLLKREMKFHLLFYISLLSTLISSGTSIYLAYLGYGFMSLVWGSLANIAAATVFASCFRPKEAFVFPSFKGSKHIFSFGGKASLAHAISQFSASTTELVIGKTLGFAYVALFSKAETVINMFAQQFLGAIRNVYFPAIAQYQRDNKQLDKHLILSTVYIVSIAFPFYGFLALFVNDIILLMFGPQWLASAQVIQILVVAGCINATVSLISTTLYAIGINLILKSEFIICIVRGLVTVPAAFISLDMVAWAQVATAMASFVVNFCLIRKFVRLRFWPFIFRVVIDNGFFAILVLAPVFYLKMYFMGTSIQSLFVLMISGFALLFSWVIFVFVVNHPFKHEMLKLIKYDKPCLN